MSTQYQIVIRSGPKPGTVYPLEGAQVTIGRDASNAISINDAEVSRRHSSLTAQGGKFILEDLGSTNGTFVNGQRISGPHVLKPGEIISLGEKIVLAFEAVTFDPNATMMSAKPPQTAAPAQRQAPAYAGQMPAGPQVPTPAAEKKAGLPMPVIIGGVVLLCALCGCAGFLWYVDSNALWCNYFPFLFGGACF
jgi:predicted component of type VI protein secretion system